MPTFNDARIRRMNDRPVNRKGDFVLLWIHGSRRLNRNHALDYALHCAEEINKPLVIYEGLRQDYSWANARHHRFLLEGMMDHVRIAHQLGLNYWPFVETPENPARGLLQKVTRNACMVIADDYPGFIIPPQNFALATKLSIAFRVVDTNSMIPLGLLGKTVVAAAHLRPRIHTHFAEAWQHRAEAEPDFSRAVRADLEPPFKLWSITEDAELDRFITQLAIDTTVKPIRTVTGGTTDGREVLRRFVTEKLPKYATERNSPDDPNVTSASRLSPYLHYGHLSIQEIVEQVLNHAGEWTPEQLDLSRKNKREGFYHRDANVNSFLDEAITWRDVGYHWHFTRDFRSRMESAEQLRTRHSWPHPVYCDLYSSLPDWASKSLKSHEGDARAFVYELAEWEEAQTHDPLWNAAQLELKFSGRIHNYLRMLWGKKVLEWSESPEKAYLILEHLNNKYALDGRDPNSYTGILWCFGLFDRPWPPERAVFGNIRYMSSDNTAKKFDLKGYYRYVERLKSESKPEMASR